MSAAPERRILIPIAALKRMPETSPIVVEFVDQAKARI